MDATSVSIATPATQTVVPTKPPILASDDPNIIYPQNISRSYPLYRLLKGRSIAVNDYIISATVGILTAVVLFGLGFALHVPFFRTWQYLVSSAAQAVLIFPVLILTYLQMPHAMADLFNVIWSNGVIEEPLNSDAAVWPDNYPEFVQRYRRGRKAPVFLSRGYKPVLVGA